jgi:SSS family solute:Na+ symporter
MNSSWMIFDTMIMIFYFMAMLGVGVYYSNKTKTSEEFLVAGRNVGFIRLFGTVTSTDIGAGYVIATVGMAYSVGFGASWLVFSSLLGAWIVAFFLSKKLKPLADKMKFVSSAHFLGYRYDKRASLLGSIMVIFANVTFVGTQIVGGAAIISAVTGMQLTTAAWISGSVVIAYTAMGGLNSVIDTDVIQVAVIVFGIFIIGVPLGIIKVGGFESLYQNLPSSFFSVGGVPTETVIKWFIAMVPSYLISMITWQRIFAAKDLKTVRKAYAFSGLLIWPFFAFFICILGMTAAVLYPGLESELVFTTFIVKALPAGVTGIIVSALTAAIMSTADSGLMCATTVFCNDIVKGYIKPDITDKQIIKTGKVTIIVIGILSLSIALYIPQILKLMMYAYQFNAAIFWPAMLGLFWKGSTSEAAFWSLLVGGIGSVVWAVLGSPYGLPPIYIAFPLTLVMMLVISKFTAHSEGEHAINVN